jgi:hypothetical protein
MNTNPKQLAIIATAVDDICLAAGLEPDDPEREDVVDMVLQFSANHRVASARELTAAFNAAIRTAFSDAIRQERH